MNDKQKSRTYKNNKRGRKNKERNNFQDMAEEREYNKGKRAGAFAIETGSSDNDPSWYMPNGQLVRDVASFPFGINVGEPLSGPDNLTIDNTSVHNMKNPGIAVFNVLPTIGTAGDQTSPVNIAGNNLFQALQVESSRNPQYEMSDMMIYVIALTSAYSYYSWLVRIYGVMNNFEILNRYTPKALINAMGVDYEDLKANVAAFRGSINVFANALASLYLPKTLDYTKRQIFLYESIYTDSDTAKAQYYMYNPVGFYEWHEGEASAAGTANPASLLLKRLPATPMTVDDLIQYGWDLIDPLRGSDDIRMIGADMIRAFTVGNCFSVAPISETFKVTPVYNAEVLAQFENAWIAPPVGTELLAGIKGAEEINTGYIMSQYAYSPTAASHLQAGYASLFQAFGGSYIVNFHKDSPSPEDILVATRCTAIPKMSPISKGAAITWGGKTVKFTNGGYALFPQTTETICGVNLYWMKGDGTIDSGVVWSQYTVGRVTGITPSSGPSPLMTSYNILGIVSRFDWFPAVWPTFLIDQSAGTPPVVTPNAFSFNEPFFDLDNFTIIGKESMNRMNEIAMLGLFAPKLNNVLSMK